MLVLMAQAWLSVKMNMLIIVITTEHAFDKA